MGNYIPTGSGPNRSISQALSEAEVDHFMDCPNADFLIRAASFILDLIFLFLIFTSLKKIFAAIAASGLLTMSSRDTTSALLTSLHFAVGVSVFFIYNVVCVTRFGGTPAKLVFGLRVIDSRTGLGLSIFQAVFREVFGKWIMTWLICGVNFVWPLIRHDSLALHDLISGTVVKKVHDHP